MSETREPAKRTASIAQAEGWPSIAAYIFVIEYRDWRGRDRRLIGRIVPSGLVARYPWRVEERRDGQWHPLNPSRDAVPPDEPLSRLLREMRDVARRHGVSSNREGTTQTTRHRVPVAYTRQTVSGSLQAVRDYWRNERRPGKDHRPEGVTERDWSVFRACLLGISRRSIGASYGLQVRDVAEVVLAVHETLKREGRGA